MFGWFKRNLKKSGKPALAISNVAKSIEEEETIIAGERCGCRGTLRIKSRLSRIDGVRVMHDLKLECDECFQNQSRQFVYEGLEATENDVVGGPEFDAPALPGNEARKHHYVFAHRFLPRAVFADPRAFLEVINNGRSLKILEALWHRVGREMEHPIVTPEGVSVLNLQNHNFLGRSGVVVSLPEPNGGVEAWYVAVLSEEQSINEPCRYLILENSEPDQKGPRAVLCEWFEDGSRQNHHQTIAPTFDNMVRVVERQLALEAKRRSVAAERNTSRRWNPQLSDVQRPSFLDQGDYRLSICAFAFYELPKALASNPETFGDTFCEENGDLIIRQIWSQTASLDRSKTEVVPGLAICEIDGQRFAILQMPTPLAPPEPFLVGFALFRPGAKIGVVRIYTLEMSSEDEESQPLLCWIEPNGKHAVVGNLPILDARQFAETILLSDRKELPPLKATDATMHVFKYAEIEQRRKDLS